MKMTLTQRIRGALKYGLKAGLDHKRMTFDIHLLLLDWLGEMPRNAEIDKWIEETL